MRGILRLAALLGLTFAISAAVVQIEFIFDQRIEAVGQGVSLFLPAHRMLDLIIVAILIFSTVACCVHMLRPEGG